MILPDMRGRVAIAATGVATKEPRTIAACRRAADAADRLHRQGIRPATMFGPERLSMEDEHGRIESRMLRGEDMLFVEHWTNAPAASSLAFRATLPEPFRREPLRPRDGADVAILLRWIADAMEDGTADADDAAAPRPELVLPLAILSCCTPQDAPGWVTFGTPWSPIEESGGIDPAILAAIDRSVPRYATHQCSGTTDLTMVILSGHQEHFTGRGDPLEAIRLIDLLETATNRVGTDAPVG